MKLNGRVALVTGSGTGIGRAISELFASEGAKVALNYHHSRDGAAELASRIRSKGGRAISIACDVSKELEVRSMIDRTHAEFGRLDILVNNAGWHSRCRAVPARAFRHFHCQYRFPRRDCAAAALFLAVDAPAITVQTILVGGGLIALGPVRSVATRMEHDA